MTHPIQLCLWFDSQALEAARYYESVFPDAHLVTDGGMVVVVQVGDQRLMLLNGGPYFTINPAISLFYHGTAEQLESIAGRLLADGGTILMPLGEYPFSKKYAWLADRYGVNWQLNLDDHPLKQKVFPSLMFTQDKAGRADEALRFYASLFDSSVGTLSRYPSGQAYDREGTLNYGEFSLDGHWFTIMDSAAPHAFTFTEGASLYVSCSDQADIDRLWNALADGGSEGRCGWLKDKFGVSWQIVPSILQTLMADPARAPRVVAAFMPMSKLIIADLERA